MQQHAWILQKPTRAALSPERLPKLWFDIMRGLGPWFKMLAAAPDDPSLNRLSIEPVGGRFRLTGDLDALSGAALHKAVEDQVGRRYRAEGPDERAATPPHARRASALVDLVTAGAEHPADGPVRSRPSTTATARP